jgi:hypothetical protein
MMTINKLGIMLANRIFSVRKKFNPMQATMA